MSVSHAAVSTVTSADEEPSDELPGLLQVLAQVPDPRRRRGKRYLLVFVLAVAVACTLAGARNFREIGDHAAGLPQGLLGRLGGRPHPLLRQIIAPSEKRIRTLLQQIDAAKLDEVTGCWLRSLAGAGRLDGLLRAIAIDGKWLRGIGDGQQVKLFAAMLHQEKVVIAQHAIPEDTNEITQVRQLLDPVGLDGAVVTADAAHAQRETAAYLAGPEDQGGRGADYFLIVKANVPTLYTQLKKLPWAAIPAVSSVGKDHGRQARRTIKAALAPAWTGFDGAAQVAQLRRTVTQNGKKTVEVVYLITSDKDAGPATLAAWVRSHWKIENCLHWVRDVTYLEDKSLVRTGNAPRVMASLRSLAISLLRLDGQDNIAAANRHHLRDPQRTLKLLQAA